MFYSHLKGIRNPIVYEDYDSDTDEDYDDTPKYMRGRIEVMDELENYIIKEDSKL